MRITNITGKNLQRYGRIVVCCLFFVTAKAQDPHFSQYFASPMTMNPALTGKQVTDWRALALFRSQWWSGTETAPFTTTSFSLEKGFATGKNGKNSLGIGLSLLSDASNAGLLKNNFFTLGAAYNLGLDANGDEQIGLGIQTSYASRLVDVSKLELQSQFGSMGFQRTYSGDPINALSNHYWDVNLGIHYSKDFIPQHWGLRLGAALYHAGTPTAGVFTNTVYTVESRYSFQGGVVVRRPAGEFDLSMITDIQGTNTICTVGGVYKLKVQSDVLESFHLGIWNRINDSFYPYIAMQGHNWLVGISYDILKPSSRAAFSSVQSMEFSLAWHFGSAGKRPAQFPKMVTY